MPVQEVGKVQFEYQTDLAQSQRSAKCSNSTFLAWTVLYEYLQCLFAFVPIIIILSVAKLAIATGHATISYPEQCLCTG